MALDPNSIRTGRSSWKLDISAAIEFEVNIPKSVKIVTDRIEINREIDIAICGSE